MLSEKQCCSSSLLDHNDLMQCMGACLCLSGAAKELWLFGTVSRRAATKVPSCTVKPGCPARAQLLRNLREGVQTLHVCGDWAVTDDAVLDMSTDRVWVQGRAPRKRISALQVPALSGCEALHGMHHSCSARSRQTSLSGAGAAKLCACCHMTCLVRALQAGVLSLRAHLWSTDVDLFMYEQRQNALSVLSSHPLLRAGGARAGVLAADQRPGRGGARRSIFAALPLQGGWPPPGAPPASLGVRLQQAALMPLFHGLLGCWRGVSVGARVWSREAIRGLFCAAGRSGRRRER